MLPKTIYIIFYYHGLKEPSSFIPLVIFFTARQSKNMYEHAFKFLSAQCDKHYFQFTPHTIYADFENPIPIYIMLFMQFGQKIEIDLKGCRFHLGQSL